MMRGQAPNSSLSDEIVVNKIYQVGNKKAIPDFDLAGLYEAETRISCKSVGLT
jgi:hypothetical protein